MGSAKITNITNMADEKKKSIKGLIKNIFGKKKDKSKENKEANTKKVDSESQKPTENETTNPVDALLKNFTKLEIEKQKEEEKDELKNFSYQKVDDDELQNFTFKTIEEERRTERTESHSSQDSGFSDVKEEDDVIKGAQKDAEDVTTKTDVKDEGDEEKSDLKTVEIIVKDEETKKEDEDLLEGLESLKIDDGKKKTQVVPVARTPTRRKVGDFLPNLHPYRDTTSDYQQINQVNKQTWSGGHVVVTNRDFPQLLPKPDTDLELQTFTDTLAQCGVLDDPSFELGLIQEYINEDTGDDTTDILDDFIKDPNNQEHIETITALVGHQIDAVNPIEELENNQEQIEAITALVTHQMETINPIEELENINHLNYEQISNLDSLIGFEEDKLYSNIYPTPPSAELAHSPRNEQFYTNFLTPPRSDVAPSPVSDSIYPTNSEYTLSPNSDCEKYQEIPQYFEETTELECPEKKNRERNPSTSSLSMKNFKDLQRDLAGSFSKKECCQINRKSCKQIFQEHLKRLKPEERKSICVKVSANDLKTCYGVLHQILIALARGTTEVDLHLVLFALVCERVLAERAQLFAEDFGLSILKAATMRCPDRPLLTRYVVSCVRTALKQDPSLLEGKDCVFKEVDAQGDTLVTACARAGDEYAAVLAELVRTHHAHTAHTAHPAHPERADRIPLFNVQHANTEGYSALHVSCRQHSAASPALHTVHVLLEHGAADIWKGDAKGNDTAVHMAVNSPTCDLSLVLLLFRHLDRKLWKKLAHVPNRSSVTPLDYARCAVKSTTRQKYPTEVLEFLKKCR